MIFFFSYGDYGLCFGTSLHRSEHDTRLTRIGKACKLQQTHALHAEPQHTHVLRIATTNDYILHMPQAFICRTLPIAPTCSLCTSYLLILLLLIILLFLILFLLVLSLILLLMMLLLHRVLLLLRLL